ncbi:MAG: ABC transporter permease [Rhodovulum sulfidophilum]|uniref:ABC transporter permease n=1 Tax=Rhodovulum sulfidophilum TaxID=35806 RepID=A0A2W5Q0C6_RHOSU|nr:MAG: ABC transporter permease [Rhodovulum sulfidophilum]
MTVETRAPAPVPRLSARRRLRRRLADWPSILLGLFGLLTLAFLVLPILLVIPMSFGGGDYLEFPPSSYSLRWYRAYFSDAEWLGSTWLSLKIALMTMLAATTLGTAAALALVRRGLAAKGYVQGMIAAPMIAPAIITAVAFYLFFTRIGLVGTTFGFVLAHTVLALPLVIFSVIASLERIDPRLEMVALSLGASRRAAIFLVTLRLALPGILIGALFAFITSFDEATVSYFVSASDAKPLPKKMFEGMEWELSPIIAAVATMLTVLSFAIVALLAVLRRRSGDRAP